MIGKLFAVLFVLFLTIINDKDVIAQDNAWQGNWFPHAPSEVDNNPTAQVPNSNLYDSKHEVKMGIKDASCDDGQSHLEQDWDFSPINYTCYNLDREQFRPRSEIPARYSQDYIPSEYSAIHKCMDTPIEYDQVIPTFGTHRPLWAKYGEYAFLPRQRWLHNLEHGAIVMLYHPCADKNEVRFLRKLVTKCLYRHVITPYNLLSPERPLALLAWGQRLEMSKVHAGVVLEFIENNALRGPEQTSKDGQYSLLLLQHADIVTDLHDTDVCKYFYGLQHGLNN